MLDHELDGAAQHEINPPEEEAQETEQHGLAAAVSPALLRHKLARRVQQRRAARAGGEAAATDGEAIISRSATGAPAAVDPAAAFGQVKGSAAGEVPYRQELEQSFGESFAGVKAHTSQPKAMAQLGARAAAQGEHVAFAEARPSRELVAHELTHVVQQRRAGRGAVAGKTMSETGDSAEQEADTLGRRAAAGERVEVSAAPTAGLHRAGLGDLMQLLTQSQGKRDAATTAKIVAYVRGDAELARLSEVVLAALGNASRGSKSIQDALAELRSDAGPGAHGAGVAGHPATAAPSRRKPPGEPAKRARAAATKDVDGAAGGKDASSSGDEDRRQRKGARRERSETVHTDKPASTAHDRGYAADTDGGDEDRAGGGRRSGRRGGGDGEDSAHAAPPSHGLEGLRMGTAAGTVADAGASVVNAIVDGPAPRAKSTEIAYVATIPTVASGKDKAPDTLAAQYRDEAFQPREAARRFAMVVGVNRMESVASVQAPQVATLQTELSKAAGFRDFRLTAMGMLWRPSWFIDGAPAPLDAVRARVARVSPDEVKTFERSERERVQNIPVGLIRDHLLKASHTTRYVLDLQRRFQSVYLHVADSDAITLRVPARSGEEAAPLFDRYQAVLDGQPEGKRRPAVASGGYQFAHQSATEDLDPRRAKAMQTVEGSRLDMAIRDGMGRVNGGAPYHPEPNMIVDASRAIDTKSIHDGTMRAEDPKRIKASFTGKGADAGKVMESRRLIESLSGKDPDWSRQHAVFDSRAALQTDAGRFDEPYVENGKAGTATDVKGLFNQTLAAQSHAPKRALAHRIADIFAHGIAMRSGGLYFVLECYLPQELLSLTGDTDGVALEAARDHLRSFATTLQAIDALVRAEVGLVPKEAPSSGSTAAAAAATARGAGRDKPKDAEKEGEGEADDRELDAGTTAAINAQIDRVVVDTKLPDGSAATIKKAIEGVRQMQEMKKANTKGARGKRPSLVSKDHLVQILDLAKEAGTAVAQFLSEYRPSDGKSAAVAAAPTTAARPLRPMARSRHRRALGQ